MTNSVEFTTTLKNIMKFSTNISKRYKNNFICVEHLFISFIEYTKNNYSKKSISYDALLHFDVDIDELHNSLKNYVINNFSISEIDECQFTSKVEKLIENSKTIALNLGHTFLGFDHILLAILKNTKGEVYRLLKNYNLNYKDLQDYIIYKIEGKESILDLNTKKDIIQQKEVSKIKFVTEKGLKIYGRNLNELAIENKFDPVIGREKEYKNSYQILNRRTKNNLLIVGDSGVGKSSFVNGLSTNIVKFETPCELWNKVIFSVDLSLIVAGTKYRGQFEERIKNIIADAKEDKNIILFIDEIHTIISAGSAEGSLDAANILKAPLSNGDIQVIGSTTFSEWRRYFEKDSALNRRFKVVFLDELSIDETREVIKNLKSKYEDFHFVKYSDEVIEKIIYLADKYIHDRKFPDKAIDILDEVGSFVKLNSKDQNFIEIENFKRKIKDINKKIEISSKSEEYEICHKLKKEREEINSKINDLEKKIVDKQKTRIDITKEDIIKVVSLSCNVPLDNLMENDENKGYKFVEFSNKYVVGQDNAKNTIRDILCHREMGFSNIENPYGKVLFLGPTGVGKTLMAKVLASFLFGNKDKIIRFDMSEFSEKIDLSKLIGAPPGYVGYDNAGKLTESVRKNPYSVLLFDEIEKAHPEIVNIFLQVLDEGKLTDNHGRTIDFRNTFIIFTSNLGVRDISENKTVGFLSNKFENNEKNKIDIINKAVKKFFSPEFLNRIGKVVIFDSLNEEQVRGIIDIYIKELNERLKFKNNKIEITESVYNDICKNGYSNEYGARNIHRYICEKIENLIAIKASEMKLSSNMNIKVDFIDNDYLVNIS